MSDKSTENYLDNLLDSMNKLQDTDTKMSGADQDEFLKSLRTSLKMRHMMSICRTLKRNLRGKMSRPRVRLLMYRLRLLMKRMLHLMICSLSLTAG